MTPPVAASRHGMAALIAAAAIGYWLVSGYYGKELLAEAAITAILAMSLSLLVGHAGLISLGHAAFFGIGAYALAGLAQFLGWAPAMAMAGAVLVGAAVAFAVGWIAVRLAGVFFIMLTLAVGEMVHAWFVKDRTFGGVGGLSGVPRLDLAAVGIDLGSPAEFALFALALAVLVYLALDRLVLSPFGQTLRAIHQNEERARALGCPVDRYKLAAFVVAGAVAALAGTLAAQRSAFVSPELMTWTLSGEILIVVIVGGGSSLLGVSAAAALWVALRHQLSTLTDHWMLAMGVIFVVLVLVAGDGLDGALRSLWRRLAARRGA
ncbi:branched-chain amino acid ABC transporter permease [Stella sp.]|uniref:branched-chain amino acid ABC transporter permease n=1 Tax=Stella sp. TaxID=2912054 RepID=UPI0035B39090